MKKGFTLFRRWNLIKKLFEEEIIDILISIIISSILEFARNIAAILFISRGNEPIEISRIKDVFSNETYDSVLNIILLTLIIWGVTGLSKMLKQSNAGKKNKIHTSLMLTIFIISLLWYIFKDFFAIDQITMTVSGILCIVLLLILCSYFIKNKTVELSVNKYQSDHRVA